MVALEPSLQWCGVLHLRVALLDGVVAGDHYPLWSDEELATLLCCLEGVVVSPLLEVLASNLLGTHLFDDYGLLSAVTIPPDVIGLYEGVWVLSSYRSGFACARWSVVPFT